MSSHAPEQVDPAAGIPRALFLKRSAGAAAALSLSSILAACGASESGTSSASSKPPSRPTGTFRFPLEGAPTTFDIAYGSLGFDYIVQRSMYDRLVGFNADYTELAPAVASRWEESEDGREFVFTIREGLTFHDGEPVDSTAVKQSLLHFQRAEGSIAMLLMPPRFLELDDSDPSVLRVVSSVPQPDFVRNQSFLGVISPKTLAKGAEHVKRNPVGSGAYKLVSHSGDGRVVVEAFEDYRGPGPYFERIEFSVVADPGARINALLAGQVDMVYKVPPTQIPRVKGSNGTKTVSGPPVWTGEYIFICCNVPPFDDARVRQACAYALDKPALVSALARGQAERLDTLSPRGVTGYADPAIVYERDVEKARALLAEAGFPDGVRARLFTSTTQTLAPQLPQAVAGQLREAGIDIQVDVIDTVVAGRLHTDLEQRRYAMFQSSLSYPSGGPLNQQVGIISLFSHYREDDVERPLGVMTTTPDGPERDAAFAAYEGAISRQVLLLPLFQSTVTDGLQDDIDGYTQTPRDGYAPDFTPAYRAD